MKIKLTQPHEHAGRTYPPGSVLNLPEDSAEWLVALGKADPETPTKAAPAAATKNRKGDAE